MILAAAVVLATLAAPAAGPLSLGLGVGAPGDGASGIPIDALGAWHLGFAVLARYSLDDNLAIRAGFGIPVAGDGVSAWGDLELRTDLDLAGAVVIAPYVAPGVQLGFTGPGYYARHSHVFVGYDYIYSGPLTPALRAPLGVSVRARSLAWLDVFLEVTPQLGILPSPDLALGGMVGVRLSI
ncbi:MAG TPA: hypothetical protein VGO62_03550 [Myxococcota bacterium]